MAVTLKEFVEETGVIEEVEDELSGVKDLRWDITSYDDNLKVIDNINHTFFVHISEHLKRIEDLKKEIQATEEAVKKEGGETISADPWYQLYETQKTVEELWLRIVGYLSLQLDVLDKVKLQLAGLIKEARTYGILKQKVETELEVLRDIKQTYIETITKMREHQFENDKRFAELLSNVLGQQKVDLTPLLSRIDMLERRIEEIESKKKSFSEEVAREYPVEVMRPEPLRGLELTKAVERLIRDEGITDKLEIAKRLNVSPAAVSLAGYKYLIEKYVGKRKEEEEYEEDMEELE
jgi:vacuolar-type H+-ATPase subunit I/STV1